MQWVLERNGQQNNSSSDKEAVIRLRGLPYGCSKEEIANFFSGMEKENINFNVIQIIQTLTVCRG